MAEAFPNKIDFLGHRGYQPGEVLDLETAPRHLRAYWNDRLSNMKDIVELSGDIPEGTEGDDLRGILQRIHEIGVSGGQCGHCGEGIRLRVRGDVLLADSECSEAGGLKPYEVLVGIPSGKIVFANDLRNLVVVDSGGSLNEPRGQKELTLSAASVGLALVFVGNTDPRVIRDGETLLVGSGIKGDRLGSISTGLWWYSAMDHDFFVDRCAAAGVRPEDDDYFVVDVEPGVYAFSDEFANHHESGVVFSRVRKVDAEAPVVVIDGLDTASTLAESRFWRDVSKHSPIGNYLVSAFTTLGFGLDWVNGGLRDVSGGRKDGPRCLVEGRVGDNIVDGIPELPGFSASSIYPIDWSYPGKLGAVPDDINLYWLAAGMMFLKSAVSSPVTVIGSSRLSKEKADEASENVQAIFVACQDYLCELATKRGLWADGSLRRAFGELSEALGEA